MALTINATWSKPLPLIDGSSENLIYKIAQLEAIPSTTGVYIFARSYGDNAVPLYVGQADNLKARIVQQLNNLKLMKGLQKMPNGNRMLLYCEAKIARGQDRKKVLAILENALIDHALSAGHELLNKQGTKRPTHQIKFSGNRMSEKLAPRNMLIRSALAKNSNGSRKARL